MPELKEIIGDIWDYHSNNNAIVIPTNGTVNSKGLAVMGRGLALQASKKYPQLRKQLAQLLSKNGNKCYLQMNNIITFPVKYNWNEKADIELIKKSCIELNGYIPVYRQIYIPRVGCGNGQLQWKDVKPVLEALLITGFYTIVSTSQDSRNDWLELTKD